MLCYPWQFPIVTKWWTNPTWSYIFHKMRAPRCRYGASIAPQNSGATIFCCCKFIIIITLKIMKVFSTKQLNTKKRNLCDLFNLPLPKVFNIHSHARTTKEKEGNFYPPGDLVSCHVEVIGLESQYLKTNFHCYELLYLCQVCNTPLCLYWRHATLLKNFVVFLIFP